MTSVGRGHQGRAALPAPLRLTRGPALDRRPPPPRLGRRRQRRPRRGRRAGRPTWRPSRAWSRSAPTWLGPATPSPPPAATPAGCGATVGLHPHEARQGVDGPEALLVEPEVVAGSAAPRLLLRALAPRGPAGRLRRPDRPGQGPTTWRWSSTHATPGPRRWTCWSPRACPMHGAALLHRRGRRGPAPPRPGRPPVVLGHRDVQGGGRRARGRRPPCPLDRMLVETDSPYLAPVPHRGRPNRPALVPLVVPPRPPAATRSRPWPPPPGPTPQWCTGLDA